MASDRQAAQAPGQPGNPPQRHYSPGRLAFAELLDLLALLREFYGVLIAFCILWLAGATYLGVRLHLSFPGALYQMLQLMAFQNGNALPSGDPALIALYFLVPFIAIVFFLPNVLSFGRQAFDKRARMPSWQNSLARTYRDHVIVCGLGRVGIRVVTRLVEAGYDVVAIEQEWESEFVGWALGLRVPVVLGDARERTVLRRAGVSRARAVVSAIDGDLIDIEIGVTARAMRPHVRVLLRAFNEEMDRNLERTFGIDTVFSTSALAAPTFAAATVARGIDYVLPAGDGRELVGIAAVRLNDAEVAGSNALALEDRFGVRVLGALTPSGQPRRLRRGEEVTLLGRLRAVEQARAMCEGDVQPVPQDETSTVVVCGLGKVGYRVVKWLAEREPRPRIVVITIPETRETFEREVQQMPGVTLVSGDARDGDVLRQAGVEGATSLAAITSNDQVNLQMALEARRICPDIHIVLRVFSDAVAARMTDLFGIHTTYSTSELASATLAAAAAIGGISRAFTVGTDLYGAQTVIITPAHPLAGRTVADLRARDRVLAVWLGRQSTSMRLPALDTVLAPGDAVLLVGALPALARVRGK